MSKHKRLKAAKRKQHNKSAKARNLEWLSYCSTRRQQAEAQRSQRAAEALANPIVSSPPADPMSLLLDGFVDGGTLPTNALLGNGFVGIFNVVHNAVLPHIDTENCHAPKLGSNEPSA